MAKALVALVGSGVLVSVFWPVLQNIYERKIEDQGARPLVIVATRGGTSDYAMHVRSFVGVDGKYRITFYVDTKPSETAAPVSRSNLDLEIVVAGTGVTGAVTCGDSTTASAVSYETLGAGPKYAYDMDRQSIRGSATNYRSGEETAAPTPSPTSTSATPSSLDAPPSSQPEEKTELVHYTGKIRSFLEGEKASSRRSVGSDGSVWVEECQIDRDLVWSGTGTEDDPTERSAATLLLPKIDFTSIDEATDFQKEFDGRVWVERGEGATLSESFPSPEASSAGWSLWYSQSWAGTRGSASNYMATDQPTLLFRNRDAARDEQNLLIIGGMAMGLALTLFVRGLSDLADFAVKDSPSSK